MKSYHILLCLLILIIAPAVALQCMPNCNSCSNPYTCDSCAPGKNCCMSSCSSCLNQIRCTECYAPNILNQKTGVCYPPNSCAPETGCVTCLNNLCTSCAAGNYLDAYTYQCLGCLSNCQTCTNSSTCTFCSERHFVNQEGTCSNCSNNCLKCTDSNNCILCVNGFTTNSKGACQQCPANCQLCSNTTTCSTCQTGYFLDDNQQCSPCGTNCRACLGKANNCTQCMDGFNSVNGTCVNCSNFFPSCQTCMIQDTTLLCLECKPGFYNVKKSSCLACMDECVSCSSPQICSQCSEGYFFNSSVPACSQCPQTHCLDCGDGQACLKCPTTTFVNPSTGTCELCTFGCDACAGLDRCFDCSDGFYLLNGVCYACSSQCSECNLSPRNCTSCVDGFFKSQNYGLCYPCPLSCPDCINSTSCNSCPPGNYLSHSSCLPCSTKNCYSCSIAGPNICSLCNYGYFLNGKQCLECIVGCDVCTNSTICQSCSQGYYLEANGTCSQCSRNCQHCSSSKNCSSCSMGYFLNLNVCYSCPNECATCLNHQQCTACQEGYFFQKINGIRTGTCLSCSPPCKSCEVHAQMCTSCLPGNYLSSSGQCTACGAGCLICNGVIGCLVCQPNYFRQDGEGNSSQWYTCLQCPEKCLTCSLKTDSQGIKTMPCSSCLFGYTNLADGSCFACGSTPETYGCSNCNRDKTCGSCISGMQLKDGICELEDMNNSSPIGFFIVVIVILSVSTAGLIGFAIYRQCSKNEGGMYREIA